MKPYLYPAFSLILLKVIILFRMFKLRVADLKTGNVHPKYFKLYDNDHSLRKETIYTARNFDNLFQLPMLFYFTIAVIIGLKAQSKFTLYTSWAFVISRYLHSYVHVTKNKLNPRLGLYTFGWFCILAIWINLLVKV
jgi:hypothetical protein